MGKAITGTALYEIKVTNPNSIANYDAGKLTKAIGDDLSEFLGKPTQGLVVKAGEATKIIEKVKKDMVAKKVQQPWIRAGLSGSDIIFLVTDLKGKYEQACTLVAGYVALKEKLKKEESVVANMEKGDKIIDWSSDTMSKAKGTTTVEGKDLDPGKITGSTPLILLAHGSETQEINGKVYGTKFAGKTEAQLIQILAANPDPAKRLSKEYSGTIYLDGCFTAEQKFMNNYTQKVWNGLKSLGYKNVKVKGNLGAATTTETGDEIITNSEAEAKAKELEKKADEAYIHQTQTHDKRTDVIWETKYAKKGDEQGYLNDPEVKKIHGEMDVIRKRIALKLEEEQKKIPGYKVKNLVGTFGLSRIN